MILILAILLSGCGKKQTPIGKIPVPNFKKKIDLLPSLVNVRYNKGTSGVESCAKCHKEIHEEWQESLHSQSMVSEAFIRESNDFKFKECLTCHAPSGLGDGENRPKARDFKLHEGVTCSSCHVVDNRTLGPIGSNAPHGVKHDKSFLTSKVCQSCHQQTYSEWDESKLQDEGLTCQACHMPTVKRYISNHSRGIYSKKMSAKHTFEIDYKNSLKLDIKLSKLIKNQISVEIENVGSGHDYPTGTYGDNTVFLELKVLDKDATVFYREEKLSAREGTSIKAKSKKRFFYTFRPPKQKSYLLRASAFFSSSNIKDDIKVAEFERYFEFK